MPGRPHLCNVIVVRSRRPRELPAARSRGTASIAVARAAAVAMLAALLLAAGAASASAVIVHLGDGRTLSYLPLRGALTPFARGGLTPFAGASDEFASDLAYGGGPVMPTNTNYAFYWDPSGGGAYPAEYQSGINQYFADLAHDSGGFENVDSVSSQFNDTAGQFANYESRFGGAIVDTDPYPANGCNEAPICLTDAQLRAELTSYIAAHGLPTDLTHEYFLLTPPGVEDCFSSVEIECSPGARHHGTYCAYHSNIHVAGGEVIYANDPYVNGVSGCDDGKHPTGKPSDGALEGGLSHEHNESITDPEPDNAWAGLNGAEIGDKCVEKMGQPLGTAGNGASYNQVINGHFYWYQEEWSNQTQRCRQRLTFKGSEPTATFTPTPGAGNEMSFNATGSTASNGIARYNWRFNDGRPPTETSTPIVTHTFPAPGTYVVALTVFAVNGTSIGTARSVAVGQAPAPAVQKLKPKRGPASGGTSITITGTGFAGVSAVKFGPSNALRFTVNSERSITAVSPPGSGTAYVTVTTAGGPSAVSRKDRFKFVR
jgi:hypothetical protein